MTSLHQQNRCLGPLTIADSWSINLLFSTEDAMEVKVQRCEKKISCTYFHLEFINLYNDASLQERNPHDLLLSVPGNVDGDAGE